MNYLWLPILILSSALGAYCAKLSNSGTPYGSVYVFFVSMIGVILWVWASRISKNLLFDSILYDVVMSLSFAISFILLKYGETFTMFNWMGVALAIIGLIMMKL